MYFIKVDDISDYLDQFEVVLHGGCSKLYASTDNKSITDCIKVYGTNFSSSKRQVIRDNYIKLNDEKKLFSDDDLILPSILYTDVQDNLLGMRMNNLRAGNLLSVKREFFGSKEYSLFIYNFIIGIIKMNKLELVLTDLKESNVLVQNFVSKFIDNDFTFLTGCSETYDTSRYLKNSFGKLYMEVFSPVRMTSEYNSFVCLCIVAKLILCEEMIISLLNSGGKFTVNSLKTMQRFIQTDRQMPQSLKKEFKNITTGDMPLSLTMDLAKEIESFLDYKYQKSMM